MSDQNYFPSFQLTLSNSYFVNPNKLVVPRAYSVYMSLVSASVPVSWYNVRSGSNTLLFRYGTNQTLTFTIPPGQYSATELADVVRYGDMSKQLGCLYLPQQAKCQFLFRGITGLLPSPLASRMGFALLNANGVYGATSDTVSDLEMTRAVIVQTNHMVSQFSSGTLELATIPVNRAFGEVLQYSNPNGFRAKLYDSKLEDIEVQFTDLDGNVLDLNGVKWCLTLQFDFKNPDAVPMFIDATEPLLNVDQQ